MHGIIFDSLACDFHITPKVNVWPPVERCHLCFFTHSEMETIILAFPLVIVMMGILDF